MKKQWFTLSILTFAVPLFASTNTQTQMSSTMMSSGMMSTSSMSMTTMNGSTSTESSSSSSNTSIKVNTTSEGPQIEINIATPATLQIYDQSNKLISTKTLNAGKTILDKTNLPAGNDTIVITVKQGNSTSVMSQTINIPAKHT